VTFDEATDTIRPPPSSESIPPEHCCGSCGAVLKELHHLRKRYDDVLTAIANPPWLPQLVEAVTTMSAAKEVRGEVADSKSRIAILESKVSALETAVRALVGDGK
jgi:hypothetical protein